jgi:hypothetical protein
LKSLRQRLPFRNPPKENEISKNYSVNILRKNEYNTPNFSINKKYEDFINKPKIKNLKKLKLKFPIPKGKIMSLNNLIFYQEMSDKNIRLKNIDDDSNITSNNGKRILYKFKDTKHLRMQPMLPLIPLNSFKQSKKKERNNSMSLSKARLKNVIENLNDEIKNIKIAITNINENWDKINSNIKEIQLKLDLRGNIEENLTNKVNTILNCIQSIIKEMSGIKDIFNSKIEKLQNENKNLLERLKLMENKVNELQGIIIGRKIIKIIIKKILKNCFIDYQILVNVKGIYEINKATLKDDKYVGMVNVVNHLIEAISTTNGIIHLIDTINKSITIINKNTTFGDIINICDLAIKQIKKNDIDSINVRFYGKKILITIIK